jgi:hypothetical protein
MGLKNIFNLIDQKLEDNQTLITYYKSENERLKKEVEELTKFLEQYREEQKL